MFRQRPGPPGAIAASGPLQSLGENVHVGTQGAGLGLRDAYALAYALGASFGRLRSDTCPSRIHLARASTRSSAAGP